MGCAETTTPAMEVDRYANENKWTLVVEDTRTLIVVRSNQWLPDLCFSSRYQTIITQSYNNFVCIADVTAHIIVLKLFADYHREQMENLKIYFSSSVF